MSLDWDNYMEYKQKKQQKTVKQVKKKKNKQIQATIYHFAEEHAPIKAIETTSHDDTLLEDFEPIVERPRRELTSNEKLAISLMGYRDYWDDLDNSLIVLDKAKVNAYVKSLGYEGRWLIGCGIYSCALCRKDGTKHKLQKVKYLDQICKECAVKYQTNIRNLMKEASTMMILNGSKRE